jgi:protein SCO1/2
MRGASTTPFLLVLTLLVGLGTNACRPRGTPPTADSSRAEAGLPATVARNRLHGVQREPALPKPDLVLTTVDGKLFDLQKDTRGFLTLLFFGYTNCPDVCPVHVANVSKVLKTLPIDVARRIRFVFVTTDPERDTPAQLKSWLAGFDAGFIGLTGTPGQLRQAQESLGLMPAAREVPDSGSPSGYLVSHSAVVFAFTSDDSAHVIYPFGIRQTDWANDLPILVNGWPRE